jgi:hypothetical protein
MEKLSRILASVGASAILLLATGASPSVVSPVSAYSCEGIRYYAATTTATMRAQPGKLSNSGNKVLHTLSTDEDVILRQVSGVWYFVETRLDGGAYSGWVEAQYLRFLFEARPGGC